MSFQLWPDLLDKAESLNDYTAKKRLTTPSAQKNKTDDFIFFKFFITN